MGTQQIKIVRGLNAGFSVTGVPNSVRKHLSKRIDTTFGAVRCNLCRRKHFSVGRQNISANDMLRIQIQTGIVGTADYTLTFYDLKISQISDQKAKKSYKQIRNNQKLAISTKFLRYLRIASLLPFAVFVFALSALCPLALTTFLILTSFPALTSFPTLHRAFV